MNPLRVALDLSCLEAQPETGVERYARRLVEHLPAAAPDLEVIVFVRPGRPAPAVRPPARIRRLASPLPRAVWRELSLPRALAEEGVGLLHSPVAALPVRGGVPRIATIHDVPDFGAPGHEGRLSRHRLRLLHAVRAARALIVPSLATRDALLRLAPDLGPRLQVIPHGVDPDFRPHGPPLKRARYGIPPGPYLLWVGTIRDRKDPRTLVEAFARLVTGHHAFADLRLVMCGDVRMAEDVLRQPLRLIGRSEQLLLPGYVAREDLPDLYREAALVIVPSRLEGFGLSALEAMACGQPPVVSSDAALVELAGEAAITFATGDSADLAQKIREALRNPEALRARSARARERAEAYSWSASATAHAALYRRVLAEAAP
jgi:glycosyltransferase involved in cell wall biosynthesis